MGIGHWALDQMSIVHGRSPWSRVQEKSIGIESIVRSKKRGDRWFKSVVRAFFEIAFVTVKALLEVSMIRSIDGGFGLMVMPNLNQLNFP